MITATLAGGAVAAAAAGLGAVEAAGAWPIAATAAARQTKRMEYEKRFMRIENSFGVPMAGRAGAGQKPESRQALLREASSSMNPRPTSRAEVCRELGGL